MFNDGNKRGWILWILSNNVFCLKQVSFLRNLSSESYFPAFCLFFSQRPKSSSDKIQYFRMIWKFTWPTRSVDPQFFPNFSLAFFVGKSLTVCARICSRPLRRNWELGGFVFFFWGGGENYLFWGTKQWKFVVVSNVFYVHPENWGRFPIWLIFFKWVETTN